MPQRRKTSRELLNSQSRTGRVAARIREEAGLPAEAENLRCVSQSFSLDEFITKVSRERESFKDRVLPGQVVALEHGARFNWREDHPLTHARSHAEWELVNNLSGTHRNDCEKFLKELSGETEFILDPVAAANVRVWLDVMTGGPNWALTARQNFELVLANGWKKRDGTDRHDETFWQSFTHRNILAQGKKIVREQL
jgi:hypothetical protein